MGYYVEDRKYGFNYVKSEMPCVARIMKKIGVKFVTGKYLNDALDVREIAIASILSHFNIEKEWSNATPLVKSMLAGRVGLAWISALYTDRDKVEELYRQAQNTLQDMFEKKLSRNDVEFLVNACFSEGWLDNEKEENLKDPAMGNRVEQWNEEVKRKNLPDSWLN
jgi:hypothetical protein